jgi:hypothetical protein
MTQDSQPIDLNEASLVAELERALQTTLFSCSGRITPRRVKQIAQEMAEGFLRFAQQEDPAVTRAYGQQLAQEGIGHRAILALSEAARRVCWGSANPGVKLMPMSDRYVTALLEGYMAEREAFVLREQQLTVQALQRTLNK